MKTPSTHKLVSVTLGGLLLLLASGCAVTTDGDYGGYGGYPDGVAPLVGLGLGLDYYNDGPFDYGGWGSGYGVGPYYHRGGDSHARSNVHPQGGDGHPQGGGMASGHSFRPAAPSRSMPSIPSGVRFGGGRGSEMGHGMGGGIGRGDERR